MIAYGNQILKKGSVVQVYSQTKPKNAEHFEIQDTRGQVLNIAEVKETHKPGIQGLRHRYTVEAVIIA